MTKTCTGCLSTKPITDFVKKTQNKDGRNTRCRICTRAMVKKHFERNRDYYRRKQAEQRKATKQRFSQIIREGKQKPCTDCDRQFDSCAMDYDHVRGRKLFNVGCGVTSGGSEARLLVEIAKCEVVCAVCHRLRTHARRQKNKLP